MSDRQGQFRRRSKAQPASSSLRVKSESAVAAGQVDHLVIGQIVAPRGLRGEVKVRVETEDPARFYDLEEVFLGDDLRRFAVRSARLVKGGALLCLEGIVDRDTAELWRGAYVYVHIRDALPLGEGEYYWHQIRGLAVTTDDGQSLGQVTDILFTGANDVYVVNGDRGEVLIPAVRETVLGVDLDHGTMTVHLPEGLL